MLISRAAALGSRRRPLSLERLRNGKEQNHRQLLRQFISGKLDSSPNPSPPAEPFPFSLQRGTENENLF